MAGKDKIKRCYTSKSIKAGKVGNETYERKELSNKEMITIPDIYISPFTDFGFKKLFGTECNKDLLLGLLNELLRKDEGEIVDITYLPTEQLGITTKHRGAIFDIYCENAKVQKERRRSRYNVR